MTIYYIDGEFVDGEKASLPVDDMIILRGYGAFDFIRTYNRKPFKLDMHLERLQNSAKLIGLESHKTNAEIAHVVEKIIELNSDLKEMTLRIILTGGTGDGTLKSKSGSRLLVLAGMLPVHSEEWYKKGVCVVSNRVERYMPGAKSTSYLSAVIAMKKAREEKAVESIYVDRKNRVLEGTTSNLFIVKNNQVITPENDVLNGVTRDVVIGLVEKYYTMSVRDFTIDELFSAEEIFLTGSTKEIVPVRKFDNIEIGVKCPGKVTKEIMEYFRDYTRNY